MQRYFLNQNADDHQRFFITNKDDIHHIKNVMRHQIDDYIIITFEDKQVYECKIIDMNDNGVEIILENKIDIDTELPQEVTICSGLIKADKYEWLLQKATELGASQFIATAMQRSVVKLNNNKVAKKLDRWEKIIKEAAEQSYRLTIPKINYASNLKEIYGSIEEYDYVLIAYENAAKDGENINFKSIIKQFSYGDRILVIFGPEGGLTEEEISLFDNKANQIGLGPRILRAETAPLYVLSAISYEKDLLE
ncbi:MULTISPECIES: 16S rRNA (uracil(1498)-N(3))-methyltransferase [Staphylococcus]|uniref:Ribosomal RNA small subunit methyltransferase E n=1 Tax=Staphylococcus hsinchuensis TaxID=3051183 RepID=A0ABZ3ECH2_9STAP|nr:MULTISPECIES: 16S rRNA (uracil(1498)-N(3))-methyltransferase [unclassified Staphylococcus]